MRDIRTKPNILAAQKGVGTFWRSAQSIALACALLLAGTACKSEFEKIRTSGDPQVLYEKAQAYFQEKEYQKAQTLYELILSSFRARKEGEDIFFKYAYTFYHMEDYILAVTHFKTFSQTYSVSPLREEAEFMAAYSNYLLSPNFRLDQGPTMTAIADMENFITLFPESKRAEECNRLIDEMRAKLERKAYEEGKLYFHIRQYQSAMNSFENLLKDFPETDQAEEVRYMIYRAAYLRAENSILEKRKERYEDTKKYIDEFLYRFPKSSYKRELEATREQIMVKIKQLENV
jgi:outer membrane protein assembly factor BamD